MKTENTEPTLHVFSKPWRVIVSRHGNSLVFVPLKEPVSRNRCLVCGVPDDDKAMCFKGTNWCCGAHRDIVESFDACQANPDAYAQMLVGTGIRMGLGPRPLPLRGEAPVPEQRVFRT